METLLQDLKLATRTLLKQHVLTSIAVLTLALGIGANTAIFSVINSVLLAPLPFREPEHLVIVWSSNPDLARTIGLPDKLPVSPGVFADWKTAQAFEKLAMMRSDHLSLTGSGNPEEVGVVRISGNFFETLGSPPLVGRTPQFGDDEKERATAAVLSHSLWQRRFGSSPNIVGRTIFLEEEPFTIVGVMPPSFMFPRGSEMPSGFGFAATPDLWVPMALTSQERQSRGSHNAIAIGRLRPGISLQAAQAEMQSLAKRLEDTYPRTDKGWGVRIKPLREELVGNIKPVLLVLLGAVGVVLLIACANVANLLLVQAAGRQKEISIRIALGASGSRIIRQLLTESVLLSCLGGVLGLLLALWILQGFSVWIPAEFPVPTAVELDRRVLTFTLVIALMTGVLAGLAPAFHMTHPNLVTALRDGTRVGSETARSRGTRRALIMTETALALLLVICAALLVRSFNNLTSIDPGFHSAGVLTFRVALPEERFPNPQRLAFSAAVLERLWAIPGVTAAGAISSLPMSGGEKIEAITIEGQPRPEPGRLPLIDLRVATSGYFETMKIPLRQGRLFSASDDAQAPRVAVIDETMARVHWPNTDPLGRRFHLGDLDTKAPWVTVVGVVGPVRNSGLHIEPRPQAYLPQAQAPLSTMMFVIRAKNDPEQLISEARAAVFAAEEKQPISEILTMEQIVNDSIVGRRFSMILLGVFALLALLLAMVGIYGVISYSVAQRTREMGLRMALGATSSRVLSLVLWEAGILAVGGVGIGLLLAFAATRALASLLFGVGPTDLMTFAGVSLCLTLVSLVAAYFPGQRATRVDPIIALRTD